MFQNNWVEVIRTGEITGQMGPVLLELNKQIRETRETHRKVSGALMYPMILICVAVSAVTLMLWLVVPVFAGMFKDMGAELPGMTQFVVDASDFIVHYGLYMRRRHRRGRVRVSTIPEDGSGAAGGWAASAWPFRCSAT